MHRPSLPRARAAGALLALPFLLALLLLAAGVGVPAASASPLADLPTVVPPPPTSTPEPPPTSTPEPPPTSTPEPPPTSTPEPPPEEEEDTPRNPPTLTPTQTLVPTATPTKVPDSPPTDLMITKVADVQTVAPGGTVAYTLRVSTSLGATVMRDVVVRDFVPEPLEIIDLAADRGDIIAQGREVTAYPATLAPGEVVTIRVTARVPADARAGRIVNVATVTTSTDDPPGNNTSSVTVDVVPPPSAPTTLPTTADPDALSPLMVLAPYAGIAVLLVIVGLLVVWGLRNRRGVPAAVPASGIALDDSLPAAVMGDIGGARLSVAPPVSAAGGAHGLAPVVGDWLPEGGPILPLPPAPGLYGGDDGAA